MCRISLLSNKQHGNADQESFGQKKTRERDAQAALVDRSFLHVLQHADLMGFGQKIGEFLEWRTSEACLPPQIRCQEPISLQQTLECSLWGKLNPHMSDLS